MATRYDFPLASDPIPSNPAQAEDQLRGLYRQDDPLALEIYDSRTTANNANPGSTPLPTPTGMDAESLRLRREALQNQAKNGITAFAQQSNSLAPKTTVKSYTPGSIPSGEARKPQVDLSALATPVITTQDVVRAEKQVADAQVARNGQGAENRARQGMFNITSAQLQTKAPGMNEDERASVDRVLRNTDDVSVVDIQRTISVLESTLPPNKRAGVTSSQRETMKILDDLRRSQSEGQRTGAAVAADTAKMEGIDKMSFADWENTVQQKISELPPVQQAAAYAAAMSNVPKPVAINRNIEIQLDAEGQQAEARQQQVFSTTFMRNQGAVSKEFGFDVTEEMLNNEPELKARYYELQAAGKLPYVDGPTSPMMTPVPKQGAGRQIVMSGNTQLTKDMQENIRQTSPSFNRATPEAMDSVSASYEAKYGGTPAPTSIIDEVGGKRASAEIADRAFAIWKQNPEKDILSAFEQAADETAEDYRSRSTQEHNGTDLLRYSFSESLARFKALAARADQEALQQNAVAINQAAEEQFGADGATDDLAATAATSKDFEGVPDSEVRKKAMVLMQGAISNVLADRGLYYLPTDAVQTAQVKAANKAAADEMARREEAAAEATKSEADLIALGARPHVAEQSARVSEAAHSKGLIPENTYVTDANTVAILVESGGAPQNVQDAIKTALSTKVPGLLGSIDPRVSPERRLQEAGIFNTDDVPIFAAVAGDDKALHDTLAMKYAKTAPVTPTGKRNLAVSAYKDNQTAFVQNFASLYSDGTKAGTDKLRAEFDKGSKFVVGTLGELLSARDEGTTAGSAIVEDKRFSRFGSLAEFQEFVNTSVGTQLKDTRLNDSMTIALYNGFNDPDVRPWLMSKNAEARQRGMDLAMVNYFKQTEDSMALKAGEAVAPARNWVSGSGFSYAEAMNTAKRFGVGAGLPELVRMHTAQGTQDLQNGMAPTQQIADLKAMRTSLEAAVRGGRASLRNDFDISDAGEVRDPISGKVMKVSALIAQLNTSLEELGAARSEEAEVLLAGLPRLTELEQLGQDANWNIGTLRGGIEGGTLQRSVQVEGVDFIVATTAPGLVEREANGVFNVYGPDGKPVFEKGFSPTQIQDKAMIAVVEDQVEALREDWASGSFGSTLLKKFSFAVGDPAKDIEDLMDIEIKVLTESQGMSEESAKQVVAKRTWDRIAEAQTIITNNYAKKISKAAAEYNARTVRKEKDRMSFEERVLKNI